MDGVDTMKYKPSNSLIDSILFTSIFTCLWEQKSQKCPTRNNRSHLKERFMECHLKSVGESSLNVYLLEDLISCTAFFSTVRLPHAQLDIKNIEISWQKKEFFTQILSTLAHTRTWCLLVYITDNMLQQYPMWLLFCTIFLTKALDIRGGHLPTLNHHKDILSSEK